MRLWRAPPNPDLATVTARGAASVMAPPLASTSALDITLDDNGTDLDDRPTTRAHDHNGRAGHPFAALAVCTVSGRLDRVGSVRALSILISGEAKGDSPRSHVRNIMPISQDT